MSKISIPKKKKTKPLLKIIEFHWSMDRRGFIKGLVIGSMGLAIAFNKEISDIKKSVIDFSKDRKLPPSGLEPEILKYFFNHRHEILFWIHDYFKLHDDKAFFFNKDTLKKIEYKVGDDHVLFKNLKEDPDYILKHPIGEKDRFLLALKEFLPSEWRTNILKSYHIRKEFKDHFNREDLKGIYYLRGRNSQVIKALESARKYHYWLKDQLEPNKKSRFSKAEIPEEFFFLALSESQLNPRARSIKDATGHLQITPHTGWRYGLDLTKYIDERRDIFKSTKAAWAYLNDLFNVLEDWKLVLTGYVAGEEIIFEALEDSLNLKRGYNKYFENKYWSKSKNIKSFFEYHNIKNSNFNQIYEKVKKHFLEKNYFSTAHYVNMFVAYYMVSNKPHIFGFHNLNYQKPVAFEEIRVEKKSLLEDILKDLEIPENYQDEFHELNSQYTLRRKLPKDITIRVPIIKK